METMSIIQNAMEKLIGSDSETEARACTSRNRWFRREDIEDAEVASRLGITQGGRI